MSCVLIVDDEPDILELFAEEFQLHDVETVQAQSVAQARSILLNTPVDAIVSDMRMPGETGLDLLRWLRRNDLSDVPFVIVTGFSDLSLDDAFRFGAHGHFSKPVDLGHLADFVSRCIALKESNETTRRRYVRAKIDVPIHLTSGSQNFGPAVLENISRGGFQCRMRDKTVPVGSTMTFRFRCPLAEGQIIAGDCEVRWCSAEPPKPSSTPIPDTDPSVCLGVSFVRVESSAIEPLLAMVTHREISREGPLETKDGPT
jgi:CheY-like chemotaxis protein